MMSKMVETPYIAIWDADVIIDKNQILDSVTALRQDKTDIAYPYDGRFLDTSDILRSLYFRKKNINVLHRNNKKMPVPYGPIHVGGAFIVNAEKYKQAGMENEKFYGWGPEDFERYSRWGNLKYRVYRNKGPLYHLSHPRSLNSSYISKLQEEQTNAELSITRSSSMEEIMENFNTQHPKQYE
jgi:predicted glycosyltransferase involved in capsule biosynthesis